MRLCLTTWYARGAQERSSMADLKTPVKPRVKDRANIAAGCEKCSLRKRSVTTIPAAIVGFTSSPCRSCGSGEMWRTTELTAPPTLYSVDCTLWQYLVFAGRATGLFASPIACSTIQDHHLSA